MNIDKILTDDEIVNLIMKYVDEKLYDYAVMIDGDWGCGKTFFVKNRLVNELDKHEEELCETDSKTDSEKENKKRNIVYVSLYGVKSIDEISKQILMESYISNKNKLKNGVEIVGKLLPTALDIFKSVTKIDVDDSKVFDTINKFIPVKNSILIFDDLERCDCPINEILGYINTFVEQSKMKVIIIANQKEIGQNHWADNRELKYLISANNEKIAFESSHKSEQDQSSSISISELKSRTDELFGQDVSYEKIKEKLIGNTIRYSPNLQSVISNLITNDNIDAKLQEYLLNKCDFFENYMIQENHINFRTFQFYLSKINEIYKSINLTDENWEIFFNCILEYCFKVCVLFKKGNLKFNMYDRLYCVDSLDKNDKNYLFNDELRFRFVDYFVVYSLLDSQEIDSTFTIYVEEFIKEKTSELSEFNHFEHNWYIMTDEDIEKNLKKTKKALDENKYDFNIYEKIVLLLVNLENAGFSKSYSEEIISIMKENFKTLKKHIVIDDGYCDLINDERKAILNEIFFDLQTAIDKQFDINTLNAFEECIAKGKEWGANLRNYISDNKYEVSQRTGFLSMIDIQNLVEKLSTSESCDIYDFTSSIHCLYINNPACVCPALLNDFDKLKELQKEVEAIDVSHFDRIKTMRINFLINCLNTAVENYKEKVSK